MPYVHVLIAGPALTEAQTERLFTECTELMVGVMGKRREVTAVAVHRVFGETWAIGGVPLDSGTTAYVEAKITAGTNTEEEKATFIARTWALLQDVVGGLSEASYIVVHEVPGSDWGYGGRTQDARLENRSRA